MSEFEFALIPAGIVIGLAIAMVLQSWGAVVNYTCRDAKPTFFLSATGLVLALILMNFAGLWSYQGVRFAIPGGAMVFSLPLLLILPVLLMFLSLAIVIPPQTTTNRNYTTHYYFVCRKFFLVLGLAMLSSNVPDLIPGVGWTLTLLQQAPGPLVCLALATTTNRLAHILGHIFLWSIMVAGYIYDLTIYVEFLNR